MKISLCSFLILTLIISSCKTREQIAREQLVDDLANQVKDGQELQSDYVSKIQNLEEQVAQVSGILEEIKRIEEEKKTKQDTELSSMDFQVKELQEKVVALEKKIEDQDVYLKQVLSTLNSLSKGKTTATKKLTPFQEGLKHYKSGRYNKARPIFASLLKKKIHVDTKKRLLHNLGVLEFLTKNYNEALGYLSKLYTDYPNSAYNKNGLLFLGKTLQKLNQNTDAKETFETLIKKYPKTKQAKEAKLLITKI